MFGHGINLNHLGVICIPIKIEMCLVMGVIPCTSKKKHPLFNLAWKVLGHKCKVAH